MCAPVLDAATAAPCRHDRHMDSDRMTRWPPCRQEKIAHRQRFFRPYTWGTQILRNAQNFRFGRFSSLPYPKQGGTTKNRSDAKKCPFLTPSQKASLMWIWARPQRPPPTHTHVRARARACAGVRGRARARAGVRNKEYYYIIINLGYTRTHACDKEYIFIIYYSLGATRIFCISERMRHF